MAKSSVKKQVSVWNILSQPKVLVWVAVMAALLWGLFWRRGALLGTSVDNGVYVTLVPQTSEVMHGDEVTLDIYADTKGYALTAIDLSILFDATDMGFVSLMNEDELSGPSIMSDELIGGVQVAEGEARIVLGNGIEHLPESGASIWLGQLKLSVVGSLGGSRVRVNPETQVAVADIEGNMFDNQESFVDLTITELKSSIELTPTPEVNPTPESYSCAAYCATLDQYSDGTCRANAGACVKNGEIKAWEGVCDSGAGGDTCCCKPDPNAPTPTKKPRGGGNNNR